MMKATGVHWACSEMPNLPEKAFASLCGSIKAHGLTQPIVLNEDGLVLDGKNRLRACEQVGVEPRFITIKTPNDPLAWVITTNRPRLRKSGQWALAAARLATAEDGTNRFERKVGSPIGEAMTRDEVSAALGISARAIDRAKFILAHGVDELLAYLEAGEITLGCAEWAAKASREEQTLACAVDVKAVRIMSNSVKAKTSKEETPMLAVHVQEGIARLIQRWPPDTPVESLVAHLKQIVRGLERRRAA